MSDDQIIYPDSDGYYHPSSEEEIATLVRYALRHKLQIRCRGAAHSLAWAIYTDPGPNDKRVPNKVSEQVPPKGPNLNVMLDRFRKLTWVDEHHGIIEVETGIHLGRDPSDPERDSSLRQSLLFQIFEKGWALADLGGITHQTVGGFLSTGSAGGSLQYDLGTNLLAFHVIDGTGEGKWYHRDEDPEMFAALGVSLGLLGIITRVRMQLTPIYFVYGQQFTTPQADTGKKEKKGKEFQSSPIDLFGPGDGRKPSMEEYLRKTPYTRILWWPQKGVERIVIWEATRGDALPVFDPVPYEQFEDTIFLTQVEQMFGAVLFTLLGNKSIFTVWKKLGPCFKQFGGNVGRVWKRKFGSFFGSVLTGLLVAAVYVISFLLVLIFGLVRPLLLLIFPFVLGLLQPISKKGKPKVFMDYMWRSLPMDNEADDLLLGTEFTEIWIPISYTEQVMRLLDEEFKTKGVEATGYYSTELYAGYKSDFWLSPAYKEDMFRIDFFWYINNEGNPAARDGYFAQFWDLLRKRNIPFRLHWGKFLPEYDYADWAAYLRQQCPKLDDFLALREKRDPGNVFLTDYWRWHLLGEEPGK